MSKSRNEAQLKSFTAYCKMYPDLRFWQALCNWSEYSKIYGYRPYKNELGCPVIDDGLDNKNLLEDTYYK